MYSNFFVLFAIILTGFILRKLKFIDEAMNNGLNKFIVYFAFPCMLIMNIGTLDVSGVLKEFFIMLGACLVLFVIYGFYTKAYAKLRHFPERVSNVAELAMMYPNNGFMGLPISLIFFGKYGLLLMMAHNVATIIYLFTVGIAVLRRNKKDKEKISLKTLLKTLGKVVFNPNIIAVFIGFVISFMGISYGEAVGTYLDMIGNVATPMAMIFIGSTLAGSNFFEMFKNRIVWESSLNKLIILPVITALVVVFTPLPSMMKAIAILGCCFPSGATVSMLAQQEGQNDEISSKILFMTTIISMATIPLCMWAIDLLPL